MKNTVMHIVHKGIEYSHEKASCNECLFWDECLNPYPVKSNLRRFIIRCEKSKGWKKTGNKVPTKK